MSSNPYAERKPGTAVPSRLTTAEEQAEADYLAMQASPEFQLLRHRLRVFVFPMSIAFLAWFLLYVLMSGFARGFMAQKVLGEINVAYVFGLLQFLSTFGIAYAYSRYADTRLDPLADELRARIEGGVR